MDTSESQWSLPTPSASGLKQKRRPPLACLQCRRRKVKCDRHEPCRPCVKAKIATCTYACDGARTLIRAPFAAEETQFSVFNQIPMSQKRSTSSSVVLSYALPRSEFGTSSPSSFHDQCSHWAIPSPSLDGDSNGTIELDCHGEMNHRNLSFQTNYLPTPDLRTPEFYSLRDIFFSRSFYGRSHWANCVDQWPTVAAVIQHHEALGLSRNWVTLKKYTALSKAVKSRESATPATHFASRLCDLVPERAISDRLVQAYFRTFQTIFGILDVPSFRQDYVAFFDNRENASETYIISLILTLCIGYTCSEDESGVSGAMRRQWLHTASAWLHTFGPREKLDMDLLRAHTLSLVARLTMAHSSNAFWLSTGSVLRMAMNMGLHVDRAKHSESHTSTADEEARRRLWATILELEVQASMDSGNSPAIESSDYDCPLPSNVLDTNPRPYNEAGAASTPKSLDEFTQSSFQILLMKTIPMRLKIAKHVNNTQSESSLEKTSKLSDELTATMKSCNTCIEAYRMSSTPPSNFQTKTFDLFVYRFLFGLHHPFAVKATTNLSFYYSRKVCLDTSLSLLSSLAKSTSDDFNSFCLYGSGVFRAAYRQSALYLCSEMTSNLQVDRPLSTDLESLVTRKELLKAVNKYTELALGRIEAGDKNCKCYIMVSCVMEQINALQTVTSAEERISERLKTSLEACYLRLDRSSGGTFGSDGVSADLSKSVHEQAEWFPWDDTLDYSTEGSGKSYSLANITSLDI
ncbi:fungal-specific transcription factor domain-containing protein [Hypoxylon cercidicola]|nr:fungal-specific transcription factor domain-containing protein [Hypoxylon cercidicola]